MRGFNFVLLGLFISGPAFAAGGFSAVCTDQITHAYRADGPVGSRPASAYWSTGERFLGGPFLNISYQDGAKTIKDNLSGKELAIIAKSGNLLIFGDASSSSTAISIWVYGINLNIKKITASQTNVFDVMSAGVMARTVELECEFSLR